jgi:glycosyltransferase involved in cell wall biosynthesis
MKWWVARHATLGLGASRKALADLFGPSWETDPRWRTLYCGVDLTPLRECVDPIAVRSELGISPDAFVIGHVGRFIELKNHAFLMNIMAEAAKQEPRACLLLIGDGELRQNIQQKVAQMGLGDRVVFAGLRPDVPRLMLGAIDVFVLPSSYEGLPLVGIEAQAAGIPFIASDVVTQEADVVKPLTHRMSLSQPASAWAEAVLAARSAAAVITQADALAILENSPFNIAYSVKVLKEIYTYPDE